MPGFFLLGMFGSLITLAVLGLSRSSRLGQRAHLLAAGASALFVATAIGILAGPDSYVESMSFWDRRSGGGLQGIWATTLAIDAGVTIALLSLLRNPQPGLLRALILLAAISSGVFFATLLLIVSVGN